MNHTVIETMAGVTSVEEPAGRIELSKSPGDTVIAMEVTTGGDIVSNVTVYLKYDQLVDLIVKAGAMAVQL